MITTLTRGTAEQPPSERRSDFNRPVSKRVSIVLIERRPLTRQCLTRWLQDGSQEFCVVSVGSPADLLDGVRSYDPQMIVFSIGAASVKDPAVLGRINLLRRHMGRIPLVLLSDCEDVDEIVEAFEHGVRGYITTSLEPSEAAAAIQCVIAGGTFVPASALIKYFAQDREHDARRGPRALARDPFESLTPREQEVLARLRQGKPNKVIAYELDISESTVKVFVRRILIKLNASNRTEAASLVRGRLNDDAAGGGAGRAVS